MKNYTSLEKMKAGEVAASYTEEKVTAETFREEVKKGTLYKGFEPPKNATMLKFRYYSPEGTLIEQNNVPVVYDGTGIESVKTYYLLTDQSSGITVDSSGWNEKPQTVTKDKRFLWTYTKTTYTNKAYSCTEPCISAVYGEQGERGAMYLGHYKDNQAAYEANKPAVFDGDYYLNTTDSYIYIYSKSANIWAKETNFDDWRYNQSINDIFAAIEDSDDVEKFIKAKKIWVQHIAAAVARVETLYSNVIKLVQGTDLDGTPKGGVIQSGNYNGTRGWKIDYDGNATFNNGTFNGTFNGLHINSSDKAAYIDFNEQVLPDGNLDGGSFSIGRNAKSKGGSIVIGNNVSAQIGNENVVIGSEMSLEKGIPTWDVMIGKKNSNSGSSCVNIGFQNSSTKDGTINIGYKTENDGQDAICIGKNSKLLYLSSSDKEVASEYPTSSIAIGNDSKIYGARSICIGGTSRTSARNCIAIGYGATASVHCPIEIGSDPTNKFRVFYFSTSTPYSTVWGELHSVIKRFIVGKSTWGGCIGSYQYELCKFGIEKVSSGGFDPICFFNASNDKVLTITNDSTKTLDYPLTLGCLPIN